LRTQAESNRFDHPAVRRGAATVAVMAWFVAGGAAALPGMGSSSLEQPGQAATVMPGALRDVAFDQRLGETVPVDAIFRTEDGREARLGDLLQGRPALLALVYYECPMLCTLTLNGLAGALEALQFDAGREFEILTVSFDTLETPDLARAKKATYLERYRRPTAAAGWHFLTGDAAAVGALTRAVGFSYAWDERARQFAHATGLVVLTPEGRIARYFYGVEFAPKDLRLALVEAADGKIGSFVDQVLLYCFHYDPATGRYSAAIMRFVRLGGVLTLTGIALFFLVARRRSRRRQGLAAVVGN
jgi:protein SCO1/2